ncbi:MAG: hypothetical protein CVU65_09870 [Deltaproteobacteria bacterium HGW-Deltaproteobacteria-22]|nr:MAG: hypothetical protein CVU65_09870 [Deltaproteobacteria bacterium HGW-Deltaproteobacteria-22]
MLLGSCCSTSTQTLVADPPSAASAPGMGGPPPAKKTTTGKAAPRCPSPHCLEDCKIHVMTRHDACGRNGGPDWPSWCAESNHKMQSDCEWSCRSGCAAGQTPP